MKKGVKIGRIVTCEIKDAFVYSIERDLGATHRSTGVVINLSESFYLLPGAIICLRKTGLHLQA